MTIGERLRALREGQHRKLSQGKLAARLGRSQRWVSQRETGEVSVAVEDAREIADGLGYAAELVILPRRHGRLIETLAHLDPEAAAAGARLAAVWSGLPTEMREMLDAVIERAERRAAEAELDLRRA